MRRRSLSEIAEIVGGRLIGENATVSSVVLDSRQATAGSLFFAVGGERTDGHDFVEQALAGGCAGAVVSQQVDQRPVVFVADTTEALTRLAISERRSSKAAVIGITGSTGKTTTKDLAAAVLSVRYAVRANPGSYNNQIGLPLTILGADEDTEVIICEMGSRGIGHISELCRIAEPDIGIVTNVGVAHMELFGSRENVTRSKAELVESLSSDGTAILSADDAVVRTFASRTEAAVITFGLASDAVVRADRLSLADDGTPGFELRYGDERQDVRLTVPGEHMVGNALAASAAGIALGIPLADIAGSLEKASISSWRMETFENEHGITVINDAYNANPASTAAALKTARWISRGGRMIAVLGTMAELGPISDAEHERVGELVARLGIDRLVTVGDEALPIAQAAVREGVEPENVASYGDPQSALSDVEAWIRSGDLILFKGSRIVGLEDLAEAMR